MTDPRSFDTELEDLNRRSVGRLLSAEYLDAAAFEALFAYLTAKAEAVADDYVVSKQVLACLSDARDAVISRGEYLAQVRHHADFAARCDLLLGMIIHGIRPSDCTPGVARII